MVCKGVLFELVCHFSDEISHSYLMNRWFKRALSVEIGALARLTLIVVMRSLNNMGCLMYRVHSVGICGQVMKGHESL